MKVATIGWCMGGGESLKASLNDPKDVNATIIHYGMPVTDVSKLKTLRGPLLGIWANKDGWITPDKVAAFDKALTEAGVKHEFHSFGARSSTFFAFPPPGELADGPVEAQGGLAGALQVAIVQPRHHRRGDDRD